MWNNSDKEDSQQYRLRESEKSNRTDGGLNWRGKSPGSTAFLIVGIILVLMAFRVFEWGETLGTSNPLQIIAMFGTLSLLALGGTTIAASGLFKVLYGRTRKEGHEQDTQSSSRATDSEES